MTIENLATFYHGGDLRGAAAAVVVVGETFSTFSYNDERKKKKKTIFFFFSFPPSVFVQRGSAELSSLRFFFNYGILFCLVTGWESGILCARRPFLS